MKISEKIEKQKIRSSKQLIESMVESAALEDIAVSKLIRAQADVVRAFIEEYGKGSSSPSNKQVNEFQGYVARIIEALTDKQKITIRRMELSRTILEEEVN